MTFCRSAATTTASDWFALCTSIVQTRKNAKLQARRLQVAAGVVAAHLEMRRDHRLIVIIGSSEQSSLRVTSS